MDSSVDSKFLADLGDMKSLWASLEKHEFSKFGKDLDILVSCVVECIYQILGWWLEFILSHFLRTSQSSEVRLKPQQKGTDGVFCKTEKKFVFHHQVIRYHCNPKAYICSYVIIYLMNDWLTKWRMQTYFTLTMNSIQFHTYSIVPSLNICEWFYCVIPSYVFNFIRKF